MTAQAKAEYFKAQQTNIRLSNQRIAELKKELADELADRDKAKREIIYLLTN
jgi:hypothetical protein